MAKYTKAEISDAREVLRGIFIDKGIREIQCKLEHVSRSGMARDIRLYVILPGDEHCAPYLRSITYQAAVLLGESIRNDGVRVTGCGMDMGFHLVYNLSWKVFGKPDTWTPEDVEKLTPRLHQNSTDPGYILWHRWI